MRKLQFLKTLRFLGFVFIVFLFLSCQMENSGLIHKRYPQGFSLKHPVTWKAVVENNKYILISSEEEETSPFAFVYPFFLKQKSRSADWLGKNLGQLDKFSGKIDILKKDQVRGFPDETALRFRFQRNQVPWQGIALCSIHEKSGILYVMAAEEESFEQHRELLFDVLSSFRFEQPEKDSIEKIPTRPQIRYHTWQDPRENAFTMDVPQGWEVQGGTFRRASVDLVHVLQAASPDGRIRIQFNDGNLPVFAVPNSTLAYAGFVEGSWYSPGYGVNMLVKRYLPGQYFLLEYLNQNYRPSLASFSVVSQKERPDVVSNFNRIYSQFAYYGISFTLHGGEAAFRFEQQQQSYVGYGLALTQLVQTQGMGNWSVALLIIYTCPEGEEDTVREIAGHMFKSVKLDPQWVASQQQLTANVSQIVTQTNQEISRIIDESYWNRQAVLDETSRRFSNYILGVTDVVDPVTGEKWKVEAGHNYYWRKDYTNQIAGTETADRPDIDFLLLKEF
ncbi:MAG: hypothetical protein ACOC57_06200 [Acidobacteriota bacterium]